MKQNVCPSCGESMETFFTILSGGLWLCESLEYLQQYVKFLRSEGSDYQPPDGKTPLHTIVGGRGYLTGQWPKKALRCQKCSTVVLLGDSLGANF